MRGAQLGEGRASVGLRVGRQARVGVPGGALAHGAAAARDGQAGGAVEARQAVDDARLRVRAHAARAAVRAHGEHVRGAAQRRHRRPARVARYRYVLESQLSVVNKRIRI